MLEISNSAALLIFCGLVAFVIVACTAIVFITEHLRTTRQSDIEAWLKHEMLERGMSAQDIQTVLEARIDGEATRLAHIAGQGVEIGLGKFQFKVGNKTDAVSAAG
jgi:hypothetical protein